MSSTVQTPSASNAGGSEECHAWPLDIREPKETPHKYQQKLVGYIVSAELMVEGIYG
jgi:hypothetical protein